MTMTYQLKGRHCYLLLQPRPSYCDRGNWQVNVFPGGIEPGRESALWVGMEIDHADMFPRYYFSLDVAKQEMIAWLMKRQQYVPTESWNEVEI